MVDHYQAVVLAPVRIHQHSLCSVGHTWVWSMAGDRAQVALENHAMDEISTLDTSRVELVPRRPSPIGKLKYKRQNGWHCANDILKHPGFSWINVQSDSKYVPDGPADIQVMVWHRCGAGIQFLTQIVSQNCNNGHTKPSTNLKPYKNSF